MSSPRVKKTTVNRVQFVHNNTISGTSWNVIFENQEIVKGEIFFKEKNNSIGFLNLSKVDNPPMFLRELQMLTNAVVEMQEEAVDGN